MDTAEQIRIALAGLGRPTLKPSSLGWQRWESPSDENQLDQAFESNDGVRDVDAIRALADDAGPVHGPKFAPSRTSAQPVLRPSGFDTVHTKPSQASETSRREARPACSPTCGRVSGATAAHAPEARTQGTTRECQAHDASRTSAGRSPYAPHRQVERVIGRGERCIDRIA